MDIVFLWVENHDKSLGPNGLTHFRPKYPLYTPDNIRKRTLAWNGLRSHILKKKGSVFICSNALWEKGNILLWCLQQFNKFKINVPFAWKRHEFHSTANQLASYNMSGMSVLTLQPSVAFHIEISHLICQANQMTGFYMKCSTGLIWVRVMILWRTEVD